MFLDPAGNLGDGDGGVLDGACGCGVAESGVPAGGEAETWCEVAGVGLQKGGLTGPSDATKTKVGVDEGPTYKVRPVDSGRRSGRGRVWRRG